MVLQLKTPEDLKDLYVVIAIVRYAIGAAIVIVNGGILIAFFIQRWKHRRPKKDLHPSACFVINLLIADTFVGAILLNSLYFKMWPENAVILAKNHYGCLFRFATGFLAICGSHSALLSVVIDRYIGVVHTMRYKDWMTAKTCSLMLVASWTLPVAGWTYIMFFGNWTPNLPTCSENTVIANFSLYFWLPIQWATLLSIVVIQVCVHVALRRYDKNICVSSAVLRRSTHKTARVMLISAIAFGLFYGPYDVAAMVFVFCPSATTKLFYDVSAIGTAATFFVNPCLYSFKTESIRRPVLALFEDLREGLTRCAMKKPEKPGTNELSVENAFTIFGSKRTCSSATLSTSLAVAIA